MKLSSQLMVNTDAFYNLVRNPDGAGGAGGAGTDSAAGAGGGDVSTETEGTPGGASADAGASGAATPPATPSQEQSPPQDGNASGQDPAKTEKDDKPWYDKREWADPALKDHLVKAGYHKGTAEEALERALKGELTAATKLGRNPSELMGAPTEGQDISEWLKSNGRALGLPESPDGYEFKLPEDMPKDLPIDDDMLAAYKAHAHESGLPPALAQQGVEFFAKYQSDQFTKMEAKAATASEQLNTELKEAWGGEYQQKQQMAVRNFQALAAKAKLTPDQAGLVAQKLNQDLGDATLLKFFESMSPMLGEDTVLPPSGSNKPALALADAQQRKAKIMEAHTGDIAVAKNAGNSRRINELQEELRGLNQIIASYGG